MKRLSVLFVLSLLAGWLAWQGPPSVEALQLPGGGGGAGVTGGTANRLAYFTSATALSTDAQIGPFMDATNNWIGFASSTPRSVIDAVITANGTAVTFNPPAAATWPVQSNGLFEATLTPDTTPAGVENNNLSVVTKIADGTAGGFATGIYSLMVVPAAMTADPQGVGATSMRSWLQVEGGANSSFYYNTLIANRNAGPATGIQLFGVYVDNLTNTGAGSFVEAISFLGAMGNGPTDGETAFGCQYNSAYTGSNASYCLRTDTDPTAGAGPAYGVWLQSDRNVLQGATRIGATTDAAANITLDVTGAIRGSTSFGVGTVTPELVIDTSSGHALTHASLATAIENHANIANVAVPLSLVHMRADSTQPVAGFGAALRFYLEGSTNGSSSVPAALHAIWEVNQTNDTTTRDGALLFFTTLNDNYDGQTVGERWRITSNGHWSSTGTNPALSACGTTPTIVGSDSAGKVTVGTGVTTSCTVTFAAAYITNAPACTVTGDTPAELYAATTSTTVLTITSSLDMDSDVISYQCTGIL